MTNSPFETDFSSSVLSGSGAEFDGHGVYRYVLWRGWEQSVTAKRMVAFIGLNPSTADMVEDDATIRREMAFAKSWGFGGLIKVNLFAYRETSPKLLRASSVKDPVGPENDDMIRKVVAAVPQVIACWGIHGTHMDRDCHVIGILNEVASEKLYHLGLTKDGLPKHPLYLKSSTERKPWF